MRHSLLLLTVLILLTVVSIVNAGVDAELMQMAQQGNVDAQFNLGQKYESGVDIPKDNKAAVKWYRLAAEQGQAKANLTLVGCTIKAKVSLKTIKKP